MVQLLEMLVENVEVHVLRPAHRRALPVHRMAELLRRPVGIVDGLDQLAMARGEAAPRLEVPRLEHCAAALPQVRGTVAAGGFGAD